MTGGNTTVTQSSRNQTTQQASPLHAVQQPFGQDGQSQQRKKSREIIHSGHFMVSDFEAEGRDEDDELSIPVPEDAENPAVLVGMSSVNQAGDLASATPGACSLASTSRQRKSDVMVTSIDETKWLPSTSIQATSSSADNSSMVVCEDSQAPAVTIDQSLTKLFQCMTLAYSSKLTSPRWKNFKGLRLQWKDKIRLNNLIWRCWHMQFIERRNTAVCQFASPLEVDQHNKPEAVVLEGKYWKRRLATVTAEYKKWRIFFKNQLIDRSPKDAGGLGRNGEFDAIDWSAPYSNGSLNSGTGSLTLDDDIFMDFSDTLFSSLSSNQPFPFPNPREIAKGAGLADFIQPGLIQLQPNLDDFMDTLEPLQELLSGRLPPVEEEIVAVEDTLARKAAFDHHNHQQQQQSQRRQDYLVHDSSPYNAATSGAAANTIPAANAATPTLLNYLQMDSQSQPFATGSPFDHAHQSPANQTQAPLAVQENNLFTFGAKTSAPSASGQPSAQNTGFEQASQAVQRMGTILQVQQQGAVQQIQSQQALMQAGFVIANHMGSVNVFDCPPSSANHGTFQRQNSAGSEHGFVVPSPAQFGKQRCRSRSGSSLMASGGNVTAILQHASALSASQPAINSSRVSRSKSSGSSTLNTSNSSPARLLNSAGQESAAAASSRRSLARMRSSSDLQPIVPHPAPNVSPPNPAVVPRPILPDNSTLLAQLLTGTNPVGAPATLVLATNTDATSPGIPLIFPVHSGASGAGESGGAGVVENKPVALLADCLRVGEGHQAFKQEPTPAKVDEPIPHRSTTRNKSGGDGERMQYKEHRRVCHINAEQKRRCNIKNGFDMLQSLLPTNSVSGSGGSSGAQSSSSSSGKTSDVSKATMLHRGAEYIRVLRQERQQQQEEMEQLKQNIEALNTAISGCQALLPANGAPVSRQRSNRMQEMFKEWVRIRTLQNWKFWIFSILIQPLLESYSSALSAATYEDLWQSVLNWVDQRCSLVALRPVVFNSLRNLSKTTDILTNPSRLPAEATQAVCSPDGSSKSVSPST